MINSGMMICSFFLKKSHSRGFEKVYHLNKTHEVETDENVIMSYKNFLDMARAFCDEYSAN